MNCRLPLDASNLSPHTSDKLHSLLIISGMIKGSTFLKINNVKQKLCSVDWSLLKSHLQTAHSLFTARLVHFNVHIPIPIYVYLSISSTYLYWSPSTLHIHQSIYLSMSTYVYLYLPTYLSNQNICLHLSGRPSTQSNVLSIVLSVCKEHGRHWGGGGMGGSGY